MPLEKRSRDGFGNWSKPPKPVSPRRDVLGSFLRKSEDGVSRQTRLDKTHGPAKILREVSEIAAIVSSEYVSASEMPGAILLNDIRHERFAQAIARGLALDAASKHAGFPNIQHALAKDPLVINRIAYWRRLGAEAAGVTIERIERELAAIAFSDMRRLMVWRGKGVELMFSEDLDDASAAAISEVRETKEGVTLKVHSKMDALGKLMSHMGMGVTRHELSGPGGKPVEVITNDMDPAKAAEAYMALIKEEQGPPS